MKWNDVLKAPVDWDRPYYRRFLRSLINEIYPDYPTRGLGQNRMEQRIVSELKRLPREEMILPPINNITGKFDERTMENPLESEEYVAMVDKVRAIIKRVFENEPPQNEDVDEFERLAAKLGGRVIMRPGEISDRYRGIPKGRKRLKTIDSNDYGKVIIFTDKFNVVWQIDVANEKVIISKGRARNLLENVSINDSLSLLRSLVNEEFYTGPLVRWYEYTLNELNVPSRNYPLYYDRLSMSYRDVFNFNNSKFFARGRPSATLISAASEQDKKRLSIYSHYNIGPGEVYAKISLLEDGQLVELEPNKPEEERTKMSAKKWADEAYPNERFRELHLLDKIGAFRSSNPDAVAQSALRFINANITNRIAAVQFFDSYLSQTSSLRFFMKMIRRSDRLRRERWRILNNNYWAQDFFENYDLDLRNMQFDVDED